MLRLPTPLHLTGFLLVCVLVLARCDTGTPVDRSTVSDHPPGEHTLVHDGLQRTYQLFVPDSYTAGTPAPLLIAFHGQSGYARNMEMTTGLDEEAERLGMIVAYLDDAVGDWAEGCGCSIADRQNVDDVGFARALTDELAQTYTLDAERIYAVGFSIGGLFVQRLACDASNLFAAVATVSATMSTPLSQTCQPHEPISVMILHGTEDPVFPWEGVQNGSLSLLSARAAIGQWRMHDACPEEPRVTEQPINASLSIREERYAPCQSETEVRLIAVEGGRHVWYQGSFSTSERVVAFLAAQRPQPSPAP